MDPDPLVKGTDPWRIRIRIKMSRIPNTGFMRLTFFQDVDGFTRSSLGSFLQQKSVSSLLPCTALAVRQIVQSLGKRKAKLANNKDHWQQQMHLFLRVIVELSNFNSGLSLPQIGTSSEIV
jgi:hypothetical protein